MRGQLVLLLMEQFGSSDYNWEKEMRGKQGWQRIVLFSFVMKWDFSEGCKITFRTNNIALQALSPRMFLFL